MVDYRFRCADCGASMVVDEGVRALLAADGCVRCGAIPEAGSFSPTEPGEE